MNLLQRYVQGGGGIERYIHVQEWEGVDLSKSNVVSGGRKSGGFEGMIFLGRAIGKPRTALLASQSEGKQSDWMYSRHAFTESVGTGGGNDGERTGLEEEGD